MTRRVIPMGAGGQRGVCGFPFVSAAKKLRAKVCAKLQLYAPCCSPRPLAPRRTVLVFG